MIDNRDNIVYCDFIDFYFNNQFKIKKSLIKSKYLKLMSELTKTQDVSDDLFEENLKKINSMGKIIIAYKINSNNSNQIELENQIELIGSGTIIIEPKILRGCKSVGHIEDIVVNSHWRGKKISKVIINYLKEQAYKSNCYKIILDCIEPLSNIYKSNGFEIKGVQMGIYL